MLVIGGGPAGTTLASLMAQRGWSVTLLEKDAHPRFHIGESLLPMNLPIFDRIGVLEKVREIGVVKNGADFSLANSGKPHETYHFAGAMGDSPGHAFEVRRSEFDALLFDNCRVHGVDARENVCVTNTERRDDRTTLVSARLQSGETAHWSARFVFDASGRDTFMASRGRGKLRNPKHASAAIFAHFRGVTRRPGSDAGNISIYWFEHGWIWLIPLPDDIMSIGMVCYPQFLKTRRGSLDDFLRGTLAGVTEIRERMAHAIPETAAQATGNYSYSTISPVGPGYMLVGDACTFIDPVFSSGVYLAMSSAERAVPVAEAWLNGNVLGYRIKGTAYQRQIKRGLKTFSWFIYRFTSPAMTNLLRHPNDSFQVVQAVTSMLAGDVYGSGPVRRRLWLFKAIYYVAALSDWRDVVAARRRRRKGVGIDAV